MIKKPLRKLTPEQARLRMADLCSRSEYCEYDILDKLKRHGISPAESQKIIDFLYDNRFLDEERFVKAFVADKLLFNGWGERKIRYELAMKKIPAFLIASVLEEHGEETFVETALKIIRVKTKNLDIDSYDDKAKLFRYLAGRGFNSSTIAKAMTEFRKEIRNGTDC